MKAQLLAGGVILAGAGAMVTVSVAGASPAQPIQGTSLVLHATAKPTHGHHVDIGRHGPSAGDQMTFGGRITGELTGTFDASCVSASRAHQLCILTFRLAGGTITAQADYGNAGTAVTPITGGSGRYVGASGQVRETEKHGGRIDKLVIDLTS